MRTLVFNTKGGSGKSLVAREVVAAPLKEQMVIVEIDPLNKSQARYKSSFADVIELDKKSIKDVLIHLNEHENVTIDVGVDNLTDTIKCLSEYALFDDIDLIVIPMGNGRDDCENAFMSYSKVLEYKDPSKIKFVLNKFDPDEPIESQYPVFFNNVSDYIKNVSHSDYVTINYSDIFIQAQNEKKLVLDLAQDIDYKSAAIAAKKSGDIDKFNALMKSELNKRAAQILVKNCIMPAHEKLMS